MNADNKNKEEETIVDAHSPVPTKKAAAAKKGSKKAAVVEVSCYLSEHLQYHFLWDEL